MDACACAHTSQVLVVIKVIGADECSLRPAMNLVNSCQERSINLPLSKLAQGFTRGLGQLKVKSFCRFWRAGRAGGCQQQVLPRPVDREGISGVSGEKTPERSIIGH